MSSNQQLVILVYLMGRRGVEAMKLVLQMLKNGFRGHFGKKLLLTKSKGVAITRATSIKFKGSNRKKSFHSLTAFQVLP
jgi:hypothetical protein